MNNQLETLPTLPVNLKHLACSNNHLETLPTLPVNLIQLMCANNQLQTLPTLPSTLENLECENNQLETLPTLLVNVTILSCSKNPLTSLPNLPRLRILKISVYQLRLLINRRGNSMSSLRIDIIRAEVTVVDEDSYDMLMHDDNMLKNYASVVSRLIARMKNKFMLKCPNFKLLVEKMKKIDITSSRGFAGLRPEGLDLPSGQIKEFMGGTRKRLKRYSKNSRKRLKRYSKKSRKYR